MKKLCLIIYTLSLLITGCTHIHQYCAFDEINTKTKGKKAKIVLMDEQELIGKNVYIDPDFTFWTDPDKENKQSVITSEVNSIILKNKLCGAIYGAPIGGLLGATMGTIGGLTEDEWGTEEALYISRTVGTLLLAGILGSILSIPGVLVGAAAGCTDKFIINVKEDIIKEMERKSEIEKIITKDTKEGFLFNVELSAPLIANSTIILKAPPHAIKNILERELSSKGFVVVSEGYADYILHFSYILDKNNRLIGFTINIINSSTDKIVGVANFQSDPNREISVFDIIKEFVNQLCKDME
jgi:hypothetical protein